MILIDANLLKVNISRWLESSKPDATEMIKVTDVFVSLMSQYQPYHRASEFPEIAKTLDPAAYANVAELASDLELDGWIQDEPDESLAGVHFKPESEQ